MTLWLTSVRFVAVSMIGAGLLWPLTTTVVCGALFPHPAGGSVVVRDGVVVGSWLVGQAFEGAGYLRGRPSAAGYDPRAAAGSNLAASNPALRDRVAADVAAVAAREGVSAAQVPADAVAASGSGLDGHVSPAYARLQVPRVAAARGLSEEVVARVVADHTSGPLALGAPRVHVLGVNLALDALTGPAGR
jgi:K+-transporting ATPase ATPase C chain